MFYVNDEQEGKFLHRDSKVVLYSAASEADISPVCSEQSVTLSKTYSSLTQFQQTAKKSSPAN